MFLVLASAENLFSRRAVAGQHRVVARVSLPLRLLPDAPLCAWVIDAWLRVQRLGVITTTSFRTEAELGASVFTSYGVLLVAVICQAVALRLSCTLQRQQAWPNDIFRLGLFASAATVLLAYSCIDLFHLMYR